MTDNKKVGDILREEREKKQISIEAIAYTTKISSSIIKEIEKNNFAKIPSKPYAKGFIKSYAIALGLDSAEILKIFERDYLERKAGQFKTQIEAYLPSQGETISNDEIRKSSVIRKQTTKVTMLFVGSIALVIILLSSMVIVGIKSYKQQKNVVVKNKFEAPKVVTNDQKKTEAFETPSIIQPEVAPPLAPAPSPSLVIIAPAPSPEVQIKPTPKVVPTAKPTPTPKPSPSPKPAHTPTPKAINTPTPSLTPKVNITPTAKPASSPSIEANASFEIVENSKEANDTALLPANIKAALVPDKQNIFINAVKGDSWLTYKNGNDPIKAFVLKQGRFILLRGDEIRVYLGNVNVTKIFYNNKLISFESKSGVKSLVFPMSNAKNYKLPLFIFDKTTGKIQTNE